MFLAICAVLAGTGCGGRAQRPRPAGSATLAGYVRVTSADLDQGPGEVTGPEQLDRYRIQPADADREVRQAVEHYRQPGVRLLVFPFAGCPSKGPSLVTEPHRVYAVLVDELPECYVAEQHLALFAVPAGLVPDGARIG